MTPYEIEILLWYSTRSEDHPGVRGGGPIWRETIDRFIADDMLRQGNAMESMVYAPTKKLHFYVEALCSVPLPRQSWIIDWAVQQIPSGVRSHETR